MRVVNTGATLFCYLRQSVTLAHLQNPVFLLPVRAFISIENIATPVLLPVGHPFAIYESRRGITKPYHRVGVRQKSGTDGLLVARRVTSGWRMNKHAIAAKPRNMHHSFPKKRVL
jgi:hypothetical protein